MLARLELGDCHLSSFSIAGPAASEPERSDESSGVLRTGRGRRDQRQTNACLPACLPLLLLPVAAPVP